MGFPSKGTAADMRLKENRTDGDAALPDGSFPIRNRGDLARAIKAFGRAKDKTRAKAHIIKRARALNATDLLPDVWHVQS